MFYAVSGCISEQLFYRTKSMENGRMQVRPRDFYDSLVQYYDTDILFQRRGIAPRTFAKDIEGLKLYFEYKNQKGYLQISIKTYNGVLCADDSMPVNTGGTYFL